MLVLSLETSTLLGSVALSKNGQVLAFEESFRQGSHSEGLNASINRILAKCSLQLKDIDLFTTGIGPGSFTGIRISLNTIKTFAYCHNKPVAALDSLSNLAHLNVSVSESVRSSGRPLISMINAYKNMVYISSYEFKNSALTEVKSPEAIRVQNLNNYITETSYIFGDGFLAFEKYFVETGLSKKMLRAETAYDYPKAEVMGVLSAKQLLTQMKWPDLLPLYIRASEAEENLKGIKFQAL